MKVSHIVVGDIYSDGKHGLRKVVAMTGENFIKVKYVLLAAKVERSFDSGKPVSLLDQVSEVSLESFATWAKQQFNEEEGARRLLAMQAVKVKLSFGELAYLQSIRRTVPGEVPRGMRFKYPHTAGRAVGGLERKGMLKQRLEFHVELTDLGVARLMAINADSNKESS